jgi:hypothetical protein
MNVCVCVHMRTHFNLYLSVNVSVFKIKYKYGVVFLLSDEEVYSMTNIHVESYQIYNKINFLLTDQAHMTPVCRILCTTYAEISTRALSHQTRWDRKCWAQSTLCKSLHISIEDRL